MTSKTFIPTITDRRTLLGGIAAGGALLTLPGCASFGGFGLTDAIRRLLTLSSERAFGRMLQGGGFWDQQVAALDLGSVLGTRGDILGRILTSSLFKSRLDRAFGEIAYRGAERAAPIVADAVRIIGFENAVDLVRGGPTAATAFLRGQMSTRLIDAMVPELGDAMRIASEPLVGEVLGALTGVDTARVATRFADSIDNTIWREIGVEESAIRADPGATRDPAIIAIFGPAARL